MALTDAAIRALKPTGQKQEIAGGKGLFLVVGTTGTKSFVQRFKIGGQSRRSTVGTYPDLKLADARLAGALIKSDVKKGLWLPATAPERSDGLTVSQAFAEYMTRRWGAERETIDHRKRARWSMFESSIEPTIGAMKLNEVTEDDLTDMLQAKYDAMVASGHTGRGIHGIRSELSAFFAWCRKAGRGVTKLKANPMDGVPVIARPIKRKRRPDDRELALTFKALDAVGGDFRDPLKMVLRSGLRVSNVFDLTCSMVVFDHPVLGPHLSIPAEIMKNDEDHLVALVPQLLSLLPDLTDYADNELLWRSQRGGYLGSDSLSNPKDRLDVKMAKLAREMGITAWSAGESEPIEPWVMHDWRRSLSSTLNEAMVDEIITERLLAHKIGGVKGLYNKAKYYHQKKEALTLWNDHLDSLLKPTESDDAK